MKSIDRPEFSELMCDVWFICGGSKPTALQISAVAKSKNNSVRLQKALG